MSLPQPDKSRTEEGGSLQLVGNQPLRLDDPAIAWIVASGSVAVFAVTLEDGVPVGRRRFLYLTLPGQALFGSIPGKWGLLAVAVRNSRLVRAPVDRLLARTRGADAAPALVDAWARHVGELLDTEARPRVHVRPEGDAVRLGEKDDLVGLHDAVTWLRVREGAILPAGEEDLRFTSDDGLAPLAPGQWMEGTGGTRLEVLSTDAALETPDVVRASIAASHARVLAWVEIKARREEEDEQNRLRRRSRERSRLAREAMQDLASVLDPRPTVPHRETPLLTAAACVGAAMGLEVRGPRASEDMTRVSDPIESIARASGFRTRRVILRGDWWARDGGPILGYVGEERTPVALLRAKGAGYVVVNPDDRIPRRLDTATRRSLAAEAVTFYPPLPASCHTVGGMVKYAYRRHRADIGYVLWTGILATLLGFVVPVAIGVIMDYAIPRSDGRLLLEMALALGAAAFGVMAFNLAQGMVLVRLGSSSDTVLQAAVWDRMLRLPSRFFRRYESGDLYQRVMAVTEIAEGFKGATLRSAISGVLAALNFVLMFWFSPRLAAIAVGVAVLSIVVTMVAGASVRKRAARLDAVQGRYFGTIVQMIGGVTKLRIAGAEHRAFNHWVTGYAEQLRLVLSRRRVQDALAAFNLLLPTLCTAILFWIGAGLIAGSPGAGLSIGLFLAFHAAFGMWVRSITSMSDTVASALDTLALGRRLHPVLQAEPEVAENAGDPGRLRGDVALEKVTFRYRDDGPRILDEVTLRAAPGEFIALVGPSGSGKSTVLRLLLGFESPESGAVLYDGKDLGGLDMLAVRRQVGVVLQNGRLNAGSIYSNIACGQTLSYDEAWEAAADAGLADEIREMPMKMHTIVAEGGGNLSGGQRQRLLIARAIATHPRVILFDEATSALDNRTQALVSEALERRKVARVVVAHRLSTIQGADRIYVLDRGRVVQTGTFTELARQKGLFKDLMQRQKV